MGRHWQHWRRRGDASLGKRRSKNARCELDGTGIYCASLRAAPENYYEVMLNAPTTSGPWTMMAALASPHRQYVHDVPITPARIAQKDLRLYASHDSGHLAAATIATLGFARHQRPLSEYETATTTTKTPERWWIPAFSSPHSSHLRCTQLYSGVLRKCSRYPGGHIPVPPHQSPTFTKHTYAPPTAPPLPSLAQIPKLLPECPGSFPMPSLSRLQALSRSLRRLTSGVLKKCIRYPG